MTHDELSSAEGQAGGAPGIGGSMTGVAEEGDGRRPASEHRPGGQEGGDEIEEELPRLAEGTEGEGQPPSTAPVGPGGAEDGERGIGGLQNLDEGAEVGAVLGHLDLPQPRGQASGPGPGRGEVEAIDEGHEQRFGRPGTDVHRHVVLGADEVTERNLVVGHGDPGEEGQTGDEAQNGNGRATEA